jgi:hypothetical protein
MKPRKKPVQVCRPAEGRAARFNYGGVEIIVDGCSTKDNAAVAAAMKRKLEGK